MVQPLCRYQTNGIQQKETADITTATGLGGDKVQDAMH